MHGARWIPALGLMSWVVAPAAFAQDSDGDGVVDAADAFPCDPLRASVSYFPGQTSSALLVFEDQWPNSTDLDFNDVAVRAHYRLERNAQGDVVSLHAVFDPVALGGELANGLGLQLPAARVGVSARRRVAGGAWQALTLESDVNATMVLSPNLRELFGGALGRLNSLPGPRTEGQRLELEVLFSPPASLSVASAPFDVFAFRAGDFGHQIHFPQYAGTAAMNTALFNSSHDASTASRRFVHLSGVPAALNLMTTTRYPLEGVQISSLFPDIVSFAGSGGATHASFYSSNVVPSQGHDITAVALPSAPVSDQSCISGILTVQSYTMQNGETGAYTYWDDTYDGSGSPTTSGALLSGGVGQLTDGVVATQNWNLNPQPYVGWNTIVPDITFFFGGVMDVDSVTLHLDDSNGNGGVAPPSAMELTVGGRVYNGVIADPASGAPFAVTFSGLGLQGNSARLRLFDGAGPWIFVSEVTFRGRPAGTSGVHEGLMMHLDAANPLSAGPGSTTWVDLSGHGRNGVLTAGASFDNTHGGAVRFDGIDDHVVIPGGFTSMFRSRTAWTVSTWLRVRQYGSGADANPVIVSIGDDPPSHYYELFLETSAGTSWLSAGGTLHQVSLSTVPGRVYNFVWVLSGSSAHIYRDGVLIGSRTGMGPMSNVTGDLWLGRFKTRDYELDGHMFQIQVYNRALSPAEISQGFEALRGRFGL